jgi:hypothetical protein
MVALAALLDNSCFEKRSYPILTVADPSPYGFGNLLSSKALFASVL